MSQSKDSEKATLAGAASAALASRAPRNLLGYEKVHHGTDTPAAQSIRKTGLRKSYSGTGVGASDVEAGRVSHAQVKGKVYTSTLRHIANEHRPGLNDFKLGERITARVPYRSKKRLGTDHVIKNIMDGKDPLTKKLGSIRRTLLKPEYKSLRIYKHSISPRFIEGSSDYAGVKQFATKGNIRRYLSQAGGKARFAKGVAQVGAAGASGLYAAAKALKARREAKS